MHAVGTVVMYSTHLFECSGHSPAVGMHRRCKLYVIMHLALRIAFDSQYAHLPLLCVQNGQTALFFASWKGYKEVVELLLQKKADVSIRNKVHVI